MQSFQKSEEFEGTMVSTTQTNAQPRIPGEIIQSELHYLAHYQDLEDSHPSPFGSWNENIHGTVLPQDPLGELLNAPMALDTYESCSTPKTLDSPNHYGKAFPRPSSSPTVQSSSNGLDCLDFCRCCRAQHARQTCHQILNTASGEPIQEAVEAVNFQVFHCQWIGCKARTKTFMLSAELDYHIRTYHLHRCPWPTCFVRKAFRRRSDLNRHLASVHSGSRKHRCVISGCGKTYSRSDKLTAHKKTHEGNSTILDPNPTRGLTGPIPEPVYNSASLEHPDPSTRYHPSSFSEFGSLSSISISGSPKETSQHCYLSSPAVESLVEEPSVDPDNLNLINEQLNPSSPLLSTNHSRSVGQPGSLHKEAILPMGSQGLPSPGWDTCQPDIWTQSFGWDSCQPDIWPQSIDSSFHEDFL